MENTYECTDCGKEFEISDKVRIYTWPPCPDCESERTEEVFTYWRDYQR